MNKVYILLGSNLGNTQEYFIQARQHIAAKIGQIHKSSSCYSTAAWGDTNQPDFLNQVLAVQTTLSPAALINTTLHIEKLMGRTRSTKNAARTIDIDILFFNNEIIQHKNLTVPHPEIQNRRFVLVPLAEIAAGYVHPVLEKTVKKLLNECPDKLNVQKI